MAGIVLFFAGLPVDWWCMKKAIKALSSAEAEYVVVSKACTMVIYPATYRANFGNKTQK